MFLYDTKLTKFKTRDDNLKKAGIVFYEGTHKDSSGKVWNVSAEQLEEIVENTNNLIRQQDIPIFQEHVKQHSNRIGDLETPIRLITIDERMIEKNPKLESLLGKTAIYSPELSITDPQIIDKVYNQKRIPISAGIDFQNNIIKEISVVGIPALNMASMFKSNKDNITYFNSPMTNLDLKAMVSNNQEEDENLEEAEQLVEHLFTIFKNINEASPQALEGNTRQDAYQKALTDFIELLEDLLPVIEEAPVEPQQEEPQVNKKNTIISDKLTNHSYNMTYNFNDPDSQYMAEFLMNPFQKKKEKKSGLVGNIAKGAAIVGAGALGVRYGGAALKRGAIAARRGAGIGYVAGAGAKGASRRLKADIGQARRGIGKAVDWTKNKFKKSGTANLSAYDYLSSFAKDKKDKRKRNALIGAGAGAALVGGGYGASVAGRAATGRGYARTDGVDYAGNRGNKPIQRAKNIGNRVRANARTVVNSDVDTIKRGARGASDSIRRTASRASDSIRSGASRGKDFAVRAGKSIARNKGKVGIAAGVLAAGGGAAYAMNRRRKTRSDKGRRRGRRR